METRPPRRVPRIRCGPHSPGPLPCVHGWWAAALLFVLVVPALVRAHPAIDERIAAVEAQLANDPENAGLLLRRGNLFRARRDCSRALADYEAAARLAPACDEVDLARARLLNEAGRPAEALIGLGRLLARRPSDPRARMARARSMERLGRHADAARDFGRAIPLMPAPRPDHFLEHARSLGRAGMNEEALAVLDQGLSRFGPVGALQRAAIETEVALGRYDDALRRLEQLPVRGGLSAKWAAQRAEILERAGRADEALAAVRHALATVRSAPATARRIPAVAKLESDLEAALQRLEARP